ncbi:hypothetical protein DTO013E5_2413 [Penicillium roqueforti]|nr:uncharacterized protein LCP9604111_1259 [Penicillium roqueforti]KAF9253733.1 hypothetical protein LCP9604111_1259 [Penicillium roqueforti]KAI2680647.1 hypothetical protein CBS147355_3627 [Penicillium roqueforti]KAI2690964.1 hypothetical protein LCP963914a_1165 [Penicillium roqueforti]KAI2741553.1 hypothetical protein DTO013F2_8763 [Penicillium roqueforti]KAI2744573.1 hypothetical protein DTO012A1_2573 [Penicillium roqueforti]
MLYTPFTGTPTTTSALTASSIGTSISRGGVAPGATSYPSDGNLYHAEPAPYVPAGGVGTNGSTPVYNAKSDFDYESLALALYQEWIELDLFQEGLRRFDEAAFRAAGLTAADREVIAFMAQQEIGHATMLSNILGAHAPKQCNYIYPYTNVKEFIDFCQKLTRWGEAGVYGFLAHLDSREAATLLTQSITTEARQQLIFRQFEGLFPMVEWFEVGIPQSWAWTLLAPFISSCPENQTRVIWQNFPTLMVVNQPDPWSPGAYRNLPSGNNRTTGHNATGYNFTSSGDQISRLNTTSGFNQTAGFMFNQTTGINNTVGPGVSIPKSAKGFGRFNSSGSANGCGAAVSKVRPVPLSAPGRTVLLEWDLPGKQIGPNNSYVTTTQTTAGSAKYVLWVSQLNITYTPLEIVNGTNSTNSTNSASSSNRTSSTTDGIRGYTTQPSLETYQGDPAFNGTIFIAITDSNPYVSPFNLSLINPHVVAGPALYQAG